MLRTALSIAFTALLAVGAFTAAQAPSERFRGTAINTAPMPGITATTRGHDAFQILADERGLLAALGEDVVSKLKIKLLVLRVGAKLTNDLLPPCMNESIRDAQQCPRLRGVTQKDGPFDVTFGPGEPAMPGETIYHAYLHDARHEGVHAICRYLMPGNRRLGCAVAFLHNGDEYKIHSATVSNDTNLGLMRCGALRLTQIVWPDVRPFDDLCPSASP